MAKPKYADCLICNETIEHVRITKHIGACIRKNGIGQPDRTNALETAPSDGHLIHIRLMSEEPSRSYYLHLLAVPDLQLSELDRVIRETWMEPCCANGHDSRFMKADVQITSSERVYQHQEPMAGASLRYLWARPGGFATYLYDLDMPVTCRIDDFGAYRVELEPEPVRLVARNQPAEEVCGGCRAAATRTHSYSSRLNLATKTDYCCEACSLGHKSWWKPLVNSPRTGACEFRGAPE